MSRNQQVMSLKSWGTIDQKHIKIEILTDENHPFFVNHLVSVAGRVGADQFFRYKHFMIDLAALDVQSTAHVPAAKLTLMKAIVVSDSDDSFSPGSAPESEDSEEDGQFTQIEQGVKVKREPSDTEQKESIDTPLGKVVRKLPTTKDIAGLTAEISQLMASATALQNEISAGTIRPLSEDEDDAGETLEESSSSHLSMEAKLQTSPS